MKADDTVSWYGRSNRAHLPALNQTVLDAVLQSRQAEGSSSFLSAARELFEASLSTLSAGVSALGSYARHIFSINLKPEDRVPSHVTTCDGSTLLKDASQLTVPTFIIWDIGGQDVFHFVHHLFLTNHGLYFLVFNSVEMLQSSETELRSLSFWTDALQLHASRAPVLLIGTRAEELNVSEIEKLDTLLAVFFKEKSTCIVINVPKGLIFFPVDNSLGKGNQKYLKDVKLAVHNQLIDPQGSNEIHVGNRRIKVSWMYLMDC